MKFLGQKGQDKWVIKEILPDLKNGFFLDLAAFDGKTNSNTYVLENDFEWSGICVEANPIYYEKLCKNRKCFTENCAVSNKKEIISFRIDNGQGGGIVAEDTDNSEKTRAEQLKSANIIEIQAITINELLEKHNAPHHINYWSLDIEGAEERVISTLDFSKYVFDCITIERPTPLCNKILQDNGYVFVKNFHFDSFYISKEIKESNKNIVCEPFEQIPPKHW